MLFFFIVFSISRGTYWSALCLALVIKHFIVRLCHLSLLLLSIALYVARNLIGAHCII